MSRIICGWCGHPAEAPRCGICGRDPVLAWSQRGREAPEIAIAPGRPITEVTTVAQRLAEARSRLVNAGRAVTVERLAEELDVSPRTVRRWQRMAG